MAEFFRYLLLANIFLVLLSLFFRLILAKERWFQFNRIILLTGIFGALIIPVIQLDLLSTPEGALIVIPEAVASFQSFQPDVVFKEIEIYGTAPFVFPWLSLFWGVFLSGMTVSGIWFFYRVSRIKQLQRANPMKWFKNLYISLLPDGYATFSFMGTVFFAKPFNQHTQETHFQLEHERVHLQQKHSWDIFFVEIIKVLFFYNPAVYSLKKQLELTHEYLADQAVSIPNRKAYAYTLLSSFMGVRELQLAHGFAKSSNLKKRFHMLEQTYVSPMAQIKYLLVVPLLIGFFSLSANTQVLAQEKKVDTQLKKSKELVMIDPVIEEPSFKVEDLEAFQKWVQDQIKYPEDALIQGLSGEVSASFLVNQKGFVDEIKILRGVSPSIDDEVRRVIKLSPLWIPAKKEGKTIDMRLSIPIKFALK